MNESSARQVLLLQAWESAQPPTPVWGDEDRAWATRLALEELPPGAVDSDDGFLVRRARHAVQRLLAREPGLARGLGRGLWRPSSIAASVGAGALLGLLADSIGSSQRINLLAPPVWGVMAWNCCVYLALTFGALRGRSPAAQPLVRPWWTDSLTRFGWPTQPAGEGRETKAGSAAGGERARHAAVLRHFGSAWLMASVPLAGRRAATLLHAGAAALGAGLILGLYARGLVLDYRAAWESTFLSAERVHGLLTHLLGPASWLSGIALPDVAGVAALRQAHGSDLPGAPAGPWIHLYALTLLLGVVVPRGLLAVFGAWRAARLAAAFPLPLGDAYFQRLLRTRSGDRALVQVLPYAKTLGAEAITWLRQVLAEVLGEGMSCHLAPTTAFGDEDEMAARRLPADTTLAIAVFDLTATPEAEHHGVFMKAVAAQATAAAMVLVWVDEAAFRQRFGAGGHRLAERRAAWRAFAAAHGCAAVCAETSAATVAPGVAALESALGGSAAVEAQPLGSEMPESRVRNMKQKTRRGPLA